MDYPLTRSFTRGPGRSRYLPIVVLGAITALGFLITVNIILTGYETVTVFQADYNITQKFWYDNYMPTRKSKAGTLCDKHVFNIGDAFATNSTLFQWNVVSITTPNAGHSGVSYVGEALQDCDVTNLYLNGDIRTWTIDISAVIDCRSSDGFALTAKTDFSTSSSKFSPILGVVRSSSTNGSLSLQNAGKATPAVVVDSMLQYAAEDIGTRLATMYARSNSTTPVALSAEVAFPWCPTSVGVDAQCAKESPQYNVTYASAIYSNTTIVRYNNGAPVRESNPMIIDDNVRLPLRNLVQTVWAAARLDLGNNSPNNFFTNSSATQLALAPTFPATSITTEAASNLYNNRIHPELVDPLLPAQLPLNIPGPAQIQVVYLCRFQHPKPRSTAVIDILVATLTTFGTGWGIFVVICVAWEKRRNYSANVCEGHIDGPSHGDGLKVAYS